MVSFICSNRLSHSLSFSFHPRRLEDVIGFSDTESKSAPVFVVRVSPKNCPVSLLLTFFSSSFLSFPVLRLKVLLTRRLLPKSPLLLEERVRSPIIHPIDARG